MSCIYETELEYVDKLPNIKKDLKYILKKFIELPVC